MVEPYTKELSESAKNFCHKQNIQVYFKIGRII